MGEIAELDNEIAEAPTFSSDGLEMIYTQDYRLHRARRATRASPWMVEGRIVELDAGGEGYPSLSSDGLTLYFESDRIAQQGFVFVATRSTVDSAFGSIARTDELDDGPAFEATSDPELAASGTYLVLSVRRNGTWDLFESTRVCQ